MLAGREATASDEAALASFVCAPESGEQPARDVQTWVTDLLDWRAESEGRHVRLFEDESGLVAVVAWRHLVDEEPGHGFFLYLLAVRQGMKREGIASGIVAGLIDHLAELEPGERLVWMVDPQNDASMALSMNVAEDEPASDPEWPHYLEFSVTL